ncbi:HAMP domain-containing sensor histidine kinase [Methylotenera sp. G11]|uniref:HAMP domain-containing sensor histidine kinase n=1 Tax=Methylotenera sp. G11 TaxID=1506585 RepID=UPI00064832B0|nr:ATP-binding protein [Methylotenera sp. G11]
MGRLYWKFFIFFFLAQLTAVTAVAIWVANQNQDRLNSQIETSPPARSLVDAAAATLQYGGVEGLHALITRWSRQPMPQVFAISEEGSDLLGRQLPADVISNARALFDRQTTEVPAAGRHGHFSPRMALQKIKANDRHEYLLFVPANRHVSGTARPKPHAGQFGFHGRHSYPVMPLLAGAFASFIFAAILAWYFSKPIQQLRNAFASAAAGNLDVRVGKSMGSRRDELADLGHAFDLMASRLGALLQSQTRLLHQVSHELRSPLARLQIAVGLARQQPDKLATSLARIERESERMDDLVGELLALSRLESGVMDISKEPVNLNELLLTVAEDARFEGETKKIIIDYAPERENAAEPIMLSAQPDLLHRAIDNVVRNAVKYTPEQSHVSIRTACSDAYVTIVVSDQGAGVLPDELEMIFQPFFRGTNTSHADGHGVGLAIAKQIIEAHGGTIAAHNEPAAGLSVLIQLPRV